MDFPSRFLSLSIFSFLVLIVLPLPQLASSLGLGSSWRYAGLNVVGRRGQVVHNFNSHPPSRNLRAGRPRYQPGPWKDAFATFYQGGSTSFGGACGYEDVVKEGYGLQTAALSTALFNNGQSCGACYEIKCVNDPQWCHPGQETLMITATNFCPPTPSDSSAWCNPPREHFDIAQPVFTKLAKEEKAGIIPVTYRRVPCQKTGGMKFTITGNPYFNQVLVWNVGGAGEVVNLQVKGNKTPWTTMKRNWGQKWVTDAKLVGQSLTFRVWDCEGRKTTAWHVAPPNWQFGQTFEGKKNFK